ncbi:hypothetical protein, partial [Saccharothrix sp. ST-888]|uniref:hypothetical protein n=1 Tax=Saccharothrix sp. ST-888 TaxID=1427391 RepID=UPI0005ECDF71
RQIWALWEHEQRISVVTFLGNRVAEALAERLAADVIPYVSLISTTAGHLASPVATDPGVLQVIGPAPRHRRTYGSTRRHLPPRDAALIGRRL